MRRLGVGNVQVLSVLHVLVTRGPLTIMHACLLLHVQAFGFHADAFAGGNEVPLSGAIVLLGMAWPQHTVTLAVNGALHLLARTSEERAAFIGDGAGHVGFFMNQAAVAARALPVSPAVAKAAGAGACLSPTSVTPVIAARVRGGRTR